MTIPIPVAPIPVSALTRRLADTPREFLADPAEVSVAAVVSDVLIAAGGGSLGPATAAPFAPGERRSRLVLVTCWLLADGALLAAPDAPARMHALLAGGLDQLAGLVDVERFVSDPDRREELARVTLRALGIQPEGETPAETEDRLSTVDSVRRHRVLAESRAAEERAEAVRKAMAEKRAQEAAARYSQV